MIRLNATERIHKDLRDWHNLRGMLPFLWEFRGRALFALGCLVLAKLANVGVPLVLKDIVDAFEGTQTQLLVLPVSLLVAYGALKLSGSLFNELRDVIFARVRFRAMRRMRPRCWSICTGCRCVITWSVRAAPSVATWSAARARCRPS